MKKKLVLMFSILIYLFPSLLSAEPIENLKQLCYDLEKDIITTHNDLAAIYSAVEEGAIEYGDVEKDYKEGVSLNVSNTEMFFNLSCKSRLSKFSIN